MSNNKDLEKMYSVPSEPTTYPAKSPLKHSFLLESENKDDNKKLVITEEVNDIIIEVNDKKIKIPSQKTQEKQKKQLEKYEKEILNLKNHIRILTESHNGLVKEINKINERISKD